MQQNEFVLRSGISRLIFFSVLVYCNVVVGQIRLDEEPHSMYYDITTRRITNFWQMKNFRDVFHYNHYLLGKRRISGNISYTTGRVLVDDGHVVHKEYRSAMTYFFRYRFFEEFSFNLTLFQDFNKQAAARWISDYTYNFGRNNWRPRRFNFGYENYSNNKYSDNFKTFAKKFLEGYFFCSYQNLLPAKLTQKIKLDSTTSVKFTYFIRYAPNYRDIDEITHGGFFKGKPTVGASVRYVFWRNLYVEGAVYGYLKESKQAWDPDYSYGFGYFDYRSFRLSITYGNWAINRFPWNKTAYPQYGFIDGQFKIAANWMW